MTRTISRISAKRPVMRRFWVWVVVAAFLVASLPDEADARRRRRTKAPRRRAAVTRPAVTWARPAVPTLPPEGAFRSGLLIDADTGNVLYEYDARREWPQASLVKMMVALVAFEAIAAGEAHIDQLVQVTRYAAAMGGSQVFLRPREFLPLRELLKAMLIASANDASAAVAESIAGSADEMIERMNERAKKLGMTGTKYTTVNGLPPRRGKAMDVSTAADLAIIAREMIKHPAILEVTSQTEVPFRNQRVRLHNTNHLVGRTPGVDGLKTGYVQLAGFNLIATAKRDDMRLIAIVLGCPTLRSRFRLAEDILEWGYANYSRFELVKAGEPLAIDVRVRNGSAASVRPVAGRGSSFLLRKGEEKQLEVSFQVPTTIAAPVAANQPLGEIIVRDGQQIVAIIPAVAPSPIAGLPSGTAGAR
jgi:serine-type D-Ala-D-Ala carboxypeptidase (penicillin-binding protein 5/6)